MYNINKIRSLKNLCSVNRTVVAQGIRIRSFKSSGIRTEVYSGENMAASVTKSGINSVNTNAVEHHHTNRLVTEKSPYLLQHANNPVDWWPWCDEAIQQAKSENKLIFLSVGYSTCHWCHVMEKESFENADVAKVMNENYINIKVDREERPDIDKIYMTFVLMINGSGGWPMSVWLTPDLAPITAGTYFPPNDRWGMPGFKSILLKIADKWKENGPELTRTGRTVIEALRKNVNEREEGDVLTVQGKMNQALAIYKRNFDDEWGGWGNHPKFPEVSKLNFLLHAHFKKPDDRIADMVLLTLTKIANGGIHDHIFGGFSRYSVDKQWHIPHFEKMLYDQAQLLTVLSNAYRLTKNQFYLFVAHNIIKYLCKDLQHPKGGFFSGEDADSLPKADDTVKIEGAFYAWDYNEIMEAFVANEAKFESLELGDNKPFDIYKYHYDIKPAGNVEPTSDPHGHLKQKNIHFVKDSIEETAKHFQIDLKQLKNMLGVANGILYEIRCQRPRPHLDTKIICAWNGLTLSGLSKIACISDSEHQQEYLRVAKQLVEFIRDHLYDKEKKVLYRSCYGEGVNIEDTSNVSEPIAGFLDDYAFLIKGLLDYYVATLDVDMLHWALELQNKQDELFWDEDNGGYFYSHANSPNVIVRLKEDHDGAEPCGNSMALHNLMLLNTYFEESHFKNRAKKLIEFFEHVNPFGYALPHMMSGLLLYDLGIEMLVVVGPDNDESKQLFSVAKNFFIPGLVPIQIKVDRPQELTRKSAVQFKMVNDTPTVYLCHNQVCQLPVTDPNVFSESLIEKYIYRCDI